ncbi:hypothetical protein OQA88_5041 [Cercophora sp. LCS_1]
MSQYDPFPVDEHVPGAALYRDDPRSVTLPQIAGEWRGPAGNMREARMQSAYDGAAMVRARIQALAYTGKSDPPGYAEITMFTTNGTNLNIYTHYATPSGENEGTLEYHQFPISSINLAGTYQGHKDGRRSLRNAQDYAKTRSEELKDELKEYWKQQRSGGLRPITKGVPALPVSGTEPPNTYENEDDCGVVEPRPLYQPTPPTSEVPSMTHEHAPSSGQKRKAPSSQGSSSGSSHHSKYKNYWTKDKRSGRFYHKHSGGTMSWLE